MTLDDLQTAVLVATVGLALAEWLIANDIASAAEERKPELHRQAALVLCLIFLCAAISLAVNLKLSSLNEEQQQAFRARIDRLEVYERQSWQERSREKYREHSWMLSQPQWSVLSEQLKDDKEPFRFAILTSPSNRASVFLANDFLLAFDGHGWPVHEVLTDEKLPKPGIDIFCRPGDENKAKRLSGFLTACHVAHSLHVSDKYSGLPVMTMGHWDLQDPPRGVFVAVPAAKPRASP